MLRSTAAAALLSGVLLTAVSSAPAQARSTDARDAFCMLVRHRQDLLDVGAGLGLLHRDPASPSVLLAPQLGPLTVEEWRQARSADFERTCDALIGATQLASGPAPCRSAPSAFWIVVPTILGAVLALFSSEWKGRRDRRYDLGQALRAAAADLRVRGNSVARAMTRPLVQPDLDAFFAARDKAVTLLQAAQVRTTRSAVHQLVAEISGRKVAAMVGPWPGDVETRSLRETAVETWLLALENDVHRISRHLDGLPHLRPVVPVAVSMSVP